MKIGIMGCLGVVGEALLKVFSRAHDIYGFDPRLYGDRRLDLDPVWMRLRCENRRGSKGYDGSASWYWTESQSGPEECAVIFICAPTPWNEEANDFDCVPVKDCLIRLAEAGWGGVAVLKSTTLPTKIGAMMEEAMHARKNAGWDDVSQFTLVACPEFLNARTAYEDTRDARHVVIGGAKYDRHLVLQVYKEAQPGIQGYFLESAEEAMMLKYMQNTYFATKNALFNQFCLMCRQFGWDYDAIRSGIVYDDRVHPVHTDVPGYDGEMGYGGMCLPKDVKAMRLMMDYVMKDHSLLAKVDEFNTHLRKVGSSETE